MMSPIHFLVSKMIRDCTLIKRKGEKILNFELQTCSAGMLVSHWKVTRSPGGATILCGLRVKYFPISAETKEKKLDEQHEKSHFNVGLNYFIQANNNTTSKSKPCILYTYNVTQCNINKTCKLLEQSVQLNRLNFLRKTNMFKVLATSV